MDLRQRWDAARQRPFTNDLAFTGGVTLVPLIMFAYLRFWQDSLIISVAIAAGITVVVFIIWLFLPHGKLGSNQLSLKTWQKLDALAAGIGIDAVVRGIPIAVDWIDPQSLAAVLIPSRPWPRSLVALA